MPPITRRRNASIRLILASADAESRRARCCAECGNEGMALCVGQESPILDRIRRVRWIGAAGVSLREKSVNVARRSGASYQRGGQKFWPVARSAPFSRGRPAALFVV